MMMGALPFHPRDTWFKVQARLALATFSKHQMAFPPFATVVLRNWARKFGVVWRPRAIPYLQLGPVPYATMGFLAHSLKAFSHARRYDMDGVLPDPCIMDVPLWHGAIFRNAGNLTCHCPRLIKKGDFTLSNLFDVNICPSPSLPSPIGPTWRVVYQESVARFQQLAPFDWSVTSVWVVAWDKSAPLKNMAPVPHVLHRQSSVVWNSLWRSKMPPIVKDFVFQALWTKLKMGDRLRNWTHHPWCPIGTSVESVDHALHHCWFHSLARGIIDYSLKVKTILSSPSILQIVLSTITTNTFGPSGDHTIDQQTCPLVDSKCWIGILRPVVQNPPTAVPWHLQHETKHVLYPTPQAGVTLISPFVARVTDWFAGGRDRPGKLSPDITTAAQEPGVARVARVVRYFRRHGYPTTVMPASLRTPEEVLALAGCDYFTIAPALLERLQNMDVPVERVLQPPTHAGDDCGCDEAKLPPMTEPAFRFALNEDCCATQSLADGIRQFSQASRDLEARLRPLLQEQLSGEKR